MQLEALERQLQAMGETDAVAADIGLARGLAAQIDAEGGSAELWREYRSALKQLREALGDDGIDDSVSDLLQRLGRPGLRDREDK